MKYILIFAIILNFVLMLRYLSGSKTDMAILHLVTIVFLVGTLNLQDHR